MMERYGKLLVEVGGVSQSEKVKISHLARNDRRGRVGERLATYWHKRPLVLKPSNEDSGSGLPLVGPE
ncbi:MAG: hypothetical protein RLN88_08720 [Ekhidna sp.]